jgi:sugar phosphate isomerase/epimerase
LLIAAQLYTVRDRLRDADGVANALSQLREIGYDSVEVAGLGPGMADHLESCMKAAGIDACAAHISLDELTASPGAVASRCSRWGCKYVVVPSVPPGFQSAPGYRKFAEMATALAADLRRYGLGLAYHNHDYELERTNDTSGLEILYSAASPENLKAELDTYWLEFAHASSAKWIRRMAGRVPLVHLKDMTIVDGAPTQTEVGEGSLDWPDILRACRDAGTEWLIVEQDATTRDPLESLDISHRNLTRLLAEI